MVTAPSVTTTHANDQLLVFQGAFGTFSGKTWTAPTGTAEAAQVNSTANDSTGLAAATLGASGPTGTETSTFGASANLTTVSVALSQAPPQASGITLDVYKRQVSHAPGYVEPGRGRPSIPSQRCAGATCAPRLGRPLWLGGRDHCARLGSSRLLCRCLDIRGFPCVNIAHVQAAVGVVELREPRLDGDAGFGDVPTRRRAAAGLG